MRCIFLVSLAERKCIEYSYLSVLCFSLSSFMIMGMLYIEGSRRSAGLVSELLKNNQRGYQFFHNMRPALVHDKHPSC